MALAPTVGLAKIVPATTVAASGKQAPADDPIAEIERFAELKKQGVITEEEFTAKKKQILGI